MISIQKEIEEYLPIDIIALEERNGILEDTIRDSIKHYNKAIELMKMDSEDIAILELKMAVSLNPHFNEAYNLLGLVYAFTGEANKAVETFKTVISAENNSIKALDYIGKIEGLQAATSLVFTDVENSKTKNVPKKQQKVEKVKKDKTINRSNFPNNYLASLKYHLIFYIIAFAIGGVLFHSTGKTVEVQKTVDNSGEITKLNNTIKDLTEKNAALTDENGKLKSQIGNINVQAEKSNNSDKLSEIEKLSSAQKFEQAADLLLLLKDASFSGEEKEKYAKLTAELYPKAAYSAYLEGMKYFSAQDYKNSSQKLQKSISYGGTWDYTPESYYNMGKSYQYLGDKQNAINAFKTLKEKFPNSELTQYVDYRINELSK